jgi:uncharacterized integral membrane protein
MTVKFLIFITVACLGFWYSWPLIRPLLLAIVAGVLIPVSFVVSVLGIKFLQSWLEQLAKWMVVDSKELK